MQEALISPHPLESGGFLLIEANVLAVMQVYRQDSSDKPEAGGILLGYRRGRHLHVIEATTPAFGDNRSRMHFYRAALPHRKIALKRWRKSGGTVDYLGEWHTHPEKQPAPSGLDLKEWQLIYGARGEGGMVFVIIGNHSQNWYGVGQGRTLRRVFLESEAS